MKSIIFLSFMFYSLAATAQATITMRIENLTDAWDEPVTYVGEVKNGKPNGLGIFIYQNGFALRYAGFFVEGLPQGKGTMLLDNGAVLTGTWAKGKPNGTGANLTSDGDLYIGQFANGAKNGKGTLIFKNNSISQGYFKDDKRNGRAIYISKDAKILSDNIYSDDEKNGPGCQYEIGAKTLFKGNWEKDNWVGPLDAIYPSFLTDTRFYAEETSNQILMGCINPDGKLQDTAFIRDIAKRKRTLGVYQNGRLRNGLIIREDSTVLVGNLNDSGATGYCTFYKTGKYLEQGTYVNDYLNGSENLSVDLAKKTIYYGSISGKGEFTGKAWFASAKNYLYRGDYLQGKLTGTGSKLDSMGFRTSGTWKEGDLMQLTQVTGPDGKTISTAPATLSEAILQLMRLYEDGFSPIEGEEVFDDLLEEMDYSTHSFYKPLPFAKTNYIMEYDGSLAHLSVLYDLADGKAASAKYEALCKQLLATKITVKPGTPPLSLTTTDAKIPIDDANSVTNFGITPDTGKWWNRCKVMVVQLHHETNNTYKVMLAVGDEDAVEGLMLLF
jgi:hypothetical protein